MLLMAVADWIALGAFVLSAGIAVITVSVLIGGLRTQVRSLGEQYAITSKMLSDHITDHARHIDTRAWDGLLDRLTRIEDGLGEIREYLVSRK